MNSADIDIDIIAIAQATIQIEAHGVLNLLPRIDAQFVAATKLLLNCTGRVVVSGIGKSGHIGRKIAATLASTGTPAFFMHPAEAAHGDLGMVLSNDVLIILSNSGTTHELMAILPSLRRMGLAVIAMTGQPLSELAKLATVHLNVGVAQEACPLALAPTASTTAALVMGDALAMAVLSAKGFTAHDFAKSHPGGALGRKLLTHVRDVMRVGADLPVVYADCLIPDALMEMSRKGMGMTAVLYRSTQVLDTSDTLVGSTNTPNTHLAGIFTDGDLRRAIEQYGDIRQYRVGDCMTCSPLTIAPDAMAIEAAQLMDEYRKNQLLVLDGGQLVGAVHTHDLMNAKIL